MKKKVYRIMLLVLVFALVFCAFALSACTDDPKPRELDSVEKSLVGTWYDSEYDNTFTFYSDGTWNYSSAGSSWRREFKHIGYGADNGDRYEIIDNNLGNNWALFDIYPNRLYSIDTNGCVIDHYIERQ